MLRQPLLFECYDIVHSRSGLLDTILGLCIHQPNIITLTPIIFLGYLAPPTEVWVEQVSVDTVNVSWSPPFTLEGVPILHYTVYITSSTGSSEAVNTTQTEISLQRPCADTTYQVSGWNEVGEGNTSSPVTYS